MDHLAICRQALGTLRRRGVCQWIEADELLSVGCLAILESCATDEALAVVVARRAMAKAWRRAERVDRGRVEVRGADADGEALSDGDQWDATIHGKQALRPLNPHVDLWEAMKALPARQYQALTLTFWNNMSDEAVAEEMGVSRQAVDALLKKAKKNISEGVAIDSVAGMTNMRGKEANADCSIGQNEAA